MTAHASRREFLKIAGMGAAALVLPARIVAQPARSRPNVLFILVDDFGWNDVGYNGSTFYETPHIDQLSTEWMRFDFCYTPSPMCSPTRTSVMTGKSPARHGVTQWLPGRQVKNEKVLCAKTFSHMKKEETTLAEAFREGGYTTGFLGKWHMGALKKTGGPKNHGFDSQLAVIETNKCAMFYPFNNHPKYFPDAKKGDNFTDKLTDAAVEFVTTKRDKPFFLYLAHFAMHAPIASKPELRRKFEAKAKKLPPLSKTESMIHDPYGSKPYKKRQDEPEYAGELATLDENIGRLVKALKDGGLYENTIIIFTGDNGGRTGFFHGPPTSVQPLRAGKTYVFEGGLRTPLLIHWPGRTKPGTNCQTPVIGMDFYPTLLEMAHLPAKPKQHVDGVSLVPLIEGKTFKRDALYWHFPHYQGEGGYPASAIRQGDYKLIMNYHHGDVLLYDIAKDPHEKNDLAASMPDKTRALKTKLVGFLKETNAKIPKPNPGRKNPKKKHKPRLGKQRVKK
ncbi:MAG: sulfatase-like hydrolase/transferase [Phycisphaerales bacterium]|jgi:arylsulfatase A-like enzyme|nr:sulfatase-like hydrolase/transferase [Phycisphaerales bacterium]